MANPPPPYDNITGISRAVMKDNSQVTLANYNGNARPGELVVNLETNPPALYVGNNVGQLTLITGGGGGGGLPLANGDSYFDIAVASGNVEIGVDDSWFWIFDTSGNLNMPSFSNLVGVTPNNNGHMQWVGNSSGDGAGYTTLQLVPDNTVEAGDQYVILDPTAPGHIHIRAGGTQDASSADLFLGGENTHFKVAAGANSDAQISANSHIWTFVTTGNLELPSEGNIVGITPNNIGHLQWVGNSSGDGGGYTTLQLVPDNTTAGGDQYLIIDPTGGGHIHIRAGGTQDASNAILFIGGENSYVSIGSGSNPPVTIAANNYSWSFGVDSQFSAAGNIYTLGEVRSGSTVTPPVVLANLTAAAGSRAFVNDANLVAVGNFGQQISGGGGNTVPVWSDGTNWYIG